MNKYQVAEIVFDQDLFSALVLIASAVAIRRFDARSVPIIAFTISFFATHLPIVNGLLETPEAKYIAEGIDAIVLVLIYSIAPPSYYVVTAALCELALIATSILFMLSDWHQWYWWLTFAIINYISLISLVKNKWGVRDGRGVVAESPRILYSLSHVYGSRRNN